MSTQLQFTASDERWFETAVTGKSRGWHSGYTQEVDDGDVAALLATGKFMLSGAVPLGNPNALTAAQVQAVQALVGAGQLRAPFDLAARAASILAAQGYSYFAPWTHDIRPILGSTLPTHSRASAATVVDYRGRMHFCRSGELRFRGARRVENLIADSEGFATGWTVGANCTLTAAASSRQCIGPRRSARQIARSSGAANILTLNSAIYRPGRYTFSIGLETDTAQAMRIRIERSSDSAEVATLDVTTPAGGMRRYAISGVITDATNHRVILTRTGGGAVTIFVNCAMLTYGDEVHEYVARGVAGAATPFEGALVDGVKYLPYESGCSIGADGVVADAGPGAAIDDATLAGVLVESYQSAQRFYQSGDVGQASQWTHTGCTVGAQGASTLLGNLGLRQITEDTSTGLHRVLQAWKLTSADGRIKTVSFYVDTTRAACPEWVVVGFMPKGADPVEHLVWFNLRTLSVGAITSGGNLTFVTPYIYREGDLVRVGVAAPGGTASASELEIGFIGFADADGSQSYTGTGRSLWIGAAQFEESDCPSSYIGDTATTVITRASEDFELARVDVLPSAEWTMTFSAALDQDPYSNGRSGWCYMVYWYLDGSNRGGVTLRQAEFSGGSSDNRDVWPMDYYFGSGSSTEIHTIKAIKLPRQRLRIAARLTRAVQADSAQIAWSMDGQMSAVGGGHTSAAGAVISDSVISLRFGRNDTYYVQRTFKGCFRQFGVMGRVPSASDLQAITG